MLLFPKELFFFSKRMFLLGVGHPTYSAKGDEQPTFIALLRIHQADTVCTESAERGMVFARMFAKMKQYK
jgi:hypothetical protein